MDENNITSLSFANYRLERAKEDLESAHVLYDKKFCFLGTLSKKSY